MQIKRGEVYYIENGRSVGSEQRPGRPAIVVSNQKNNASSATVEVVYLTTQPKHDLPTHTTIKSLNRESIAICEQITTVAVERMGNRMGVITDEEMEGVERAMLISLGMNPEREFPEEESINPDDRLAAAEARCVVLQQMYDSLLDRMLRSGR